MGGDRWRLREIGIEITAKNWTADNIHYLERQFIVTVDGDLSRPRLELGKVAECRWVDETTSFLLKENRLAGDVIIYDSVVEALRYTKPNVYRAASTGEASACSASSASMSELTPAIKKPTPKFRVEPS